MTHRAARGAACACAARRLGPRRLRRLRLPSRRWGLPGANAWSSRATAARDRRGRSRSACVPRRRTKAAAAAHVVAVAAARAPTFHSANSTPRAPHVDPSDARSASPGRARQRDRQTAPRLSRAKAHGVLTVLGPIGSDRDADSRALGASRRGPAQVAVRGGAPSATMPTATTPAVPPPARAARCDPRCARSHRGRREHEH